MLPILKPFVKAFFKTKAFAIKNAPELMVGAGVTTGSVWNWGGVTTASEYTGPFQFHDCGNGRC